MHFWRKQNMDEMREVQIGSELIYEGKMTDGKTVAAIMTYAAKYGREQAAK